MMPPLSAARFDAYWRLMRFDKPIGILLLLWPGLWALWIAGQGHPTPSVVLVIALGTVLMRAAGCVINDYADRDFDPHVERTKLRPIAAGEIAPRSALWLFVALCLVAFVLVLTMNWLTIALSVPGALLAASYPFMKRYTHWPQAYLGLAFGWAVPMSFAAETGGIPFIAWEIYAATILWALIYDTLYAMVDRDDDLKIGVKSTAILFGRHDRLILALLQALMLAILGAVGRQADLGGAYYAGLAVAAGLAGYQQGLIRERGKPECFRAFLNNNWFGLAVFAGLALDYALR
ncbi:4-hydroxybenzoate octaprenyltransferase [Methylomagnum ishizawai]|uniref:4-hydroxybenzoate octaprenyltransferase n=1 Tax=Methylomagnum ishizawai TaxID=1760988 RepID=UPI001C326DA3|nr:4-hydroxybenzoate octaprenyltransferase [Methylomagnum ishizawai]BBL75774.1 4-hydroxybenzoate octaprenyltransferase [Methylomagnum ishizawai]